MQPRRNGSLTALDNSNTTLYIEAALQKVARLSSLTYRFQNGFISLHLMSKLNDPDEETNLYFTERVLQENSENKIFIG